MASYQTIFTIHRTQLTLQCNYLSKAKAIYGSDIIYVNAKWKDNRNDDICIHSFIILFICIEYEVCLPFTSTFLEDLRTLKSSYTQEVQFVLLHRKLNNSTLFCSMKFDLLFVSSIGFELYFSFKWVLDIFSINNQMQCERNTIWWVGGSGLVFYMYVSLDQYIHFSAMNRTVNTRCEID